MLERSLENFCTRSKISKKKIFQWRLITDTTPDFDLFHFLAACWTEIWSHCAYVNWLFDVSYCLEPEPTGYYLRFRSNLSTVSYPREDNLATITVFQFNLLFLLFWSWLHIASFQPLCPTSESKAYIHLLSICSATDYVYNDVVDSLKM